MDPLRIAVRAVFAYVFLLAMVRISGKEAIKQATPFDFVLALILGDMVDDVLWAEVSVSSFVVAVTTLFLADIISSTVSLRARAGGG
jgi:uncharacterized membrane protein YcaP (DUF421 family)